MKQKLVKFSPFPRAAELLHKAETFFKAEILLRHRQWVQTVCIEGKPVAFLEDLKAKSRAQGGGNMALPALTDDEPGTHCNNLEFSALAEFFLHSPNYWAVCRGPPRFSTVAHPKFPTWRCCKHWQHLRNANSG